MSNDNGNIQNIAERAAGSAVLTTTARIFAVVTPMVFIPLLVWLFSTVAENQTTIARVEVQTQTNTDRIVHLESNLTSLTDYIRKDHDDRQHDWLEVRERMVRVETQNTTILDEIKRLNAMLDKKEKVR